MIPRYRQPTCCEDETPATMPDLDDTRPFPIQGGGSVRGKGELGPTVIPWWLAEVAYEYYHSRWPGQSLERLAERGGFGREELIGFIRREL